MKIIKKEKLEKKLIKLKKIKSDHIFLDFGNTFGFFVFLCFIFVFLFILEMIVLDLNQYIFYTSFVILSSFFSLTVLYHYGFHSKRKSTFKKNIFKRCEKIEEELKEYEIENNLDIYFKELQILKENGEILLINELTLQKVIELHKEEKLKENKYSYFNKKETEKEDEITIS